MPSAAIRVIDVYPYRRLPEGRQEFLVLRRSPDQRFAGQWRMVGGKIEEGETAWEAALRECIEEVGQQPRQFWALPSVNTFYDWQRDKVNIVPAFAAELEGDPVLNYEHDLFKWLDAEAAADLLVWPEQQRLLQLAAKILNEGGLIDELIVRSVSGDEERSLPRTPIRGTKNEACPGHRSGEQRTKNEERRTGTGVSTALHPTTLYRQTPRAISYRTP